MSTDSRSSTYGCQARSLDESKTLKITKAAQIKLLLKLDTRFNEARFVHSFSEIEIHLDTKKISFSVMSSQIIRVILYGPFFPKKTLKYFLVSGLDRKSVV